MYLPSVFRPADTALALDLIEQHPFATLVTSHDGASTADHVPLLLDRVRGVLRGHVARANPVWRALASGVEALAIFHGPHAYVSPAFYPSGRVHVPTWNYATVHVYGVARVIASATELSALVSAMTSHFEAGRPAPFALDIVDPARQAMLAAIVGFELPLGRVEAKVKLSQNRTADERAGVIRAFEASEVAEERAVAEWMRRVE
jgi:transcriptional regulator